MKDFQLESYASEDALCKAFVKNVNHRISIGMARPHIFFHIVNEQPRQKNGSATAAAIIGKRLNDMGRKAGVLDYEFIWKDELGRTCFAFLEAKNGKNPLTKSQCDFIEDCKRFNIPTGVFRTVQQGVRILEDWGILKPEKFY